MWRMGRTTGGRGRQLPQSESLNSRWGICRSIFSRAAGRTRAGGGAPRNFQELQRVRCLRSPTRFAAEGGTVMTERGEALRGLLLLPTGPDRHSDPPSARVSVPVSVGRGEAASEGE